MDGPPRLHLDAETPDIALSSEAAADLGAAIVARHERWWTLRFPGGLAFCLLAASEHQLPDAVTWPQGHRSRMAQVCLGAPAVAHEAEVAFWRALLRGRWAESDSDEFAGKWHDDAGSPLQLLFQRQDGPAGSCGPTSTSELWTSPRAGLARAA